MGIFDAFRGKPSGIKSVSYDFWHDITIVPFGDIHLGAPTCNIDKLNTALNFLYNSDCYVILMGDLMEAASRHSVGSGWAEQVRDPQAQLDTWHEALEPISDRILLLLDGNHEARIYKHSGIEVSKVLAKLLGVPYGGYSAYVKIRCDRQNYIIYAQHGATSAWYPSTKMTAAIRTAMHSEADIYLYGHTHELMSLAMPHRVMDKRSRTVQYRKKYFCLTGSMLEFHGSYAERKNLHPVKTGLANIHLDADKWDVHVET